MSLVNDMLRDLDRRGVKVARSDSQGPEPERAVVDGRHSSPKPWLAAVAAFVFVGVGLLGWNVLSGSSSPQAPNVPEVSDVQERVIETPREPNGPAEVLAALDIPGPEPEPELEAVEEPIEEVLELTALQNAKIGRLLAEAELALGRDRLTSPIEDNAFSRYREILSLSPEHPEALAGIERITRRYLDLTEGHLERNDLERAEVMLRRARTVQQNHPGIVQLAEQLAAASEARPEESQPAPTSRQAAVNTTANTTGENAPEQHLEVTRTAARQDERIAREARELLQQGRHHSARLRLEKWLEQHPDSVHSATELAGIYIDQGNIEAAQALLDEAEFLSTGERTRLRARLALVQGQPEEAIALLEADLPEADDNEPYRSLLAGLYYRADRHAEAASAYRRLLDNFGAKPGYWLGLALALDAQQQHASAVESYRRALTSGHYDTRENREVRDYIEQRITTLTR
ncbi:tetratricopeptide repeat protein [Marinimicrobium sp. ABcell2]|uniref:tetratricopeptide repeat protein n=1 Tax=Marinimicrobium sp. ABcell2 TaxID=3069751 RepID=UPI0027B63160|nr:tetratricopeptide repeat protein [Marinimicrobium sp. ABcell2]MDQ2075224.1 tetratricopeptide repeat protein [Marinimicrobium sp. ABcell2]